MRPTERQDGNTVLLYQWSIFIRLPPTLRVCIYLYVNKHPVLATHCRVVKTSDELSETCRVS